MASRNVTEQHKSSGEQRVRRIAPELDWQDGHWPGTTRYRDVYWAAKNEMSLRSLRELVYRLDIPHIPIGNVIWIDSEDMVAYLPKVQRPPKKPRKPTQQRKKRPIDGKEAKGPQTRKR